MFARVDGQAVRELARYGTVSLAGLLANLALLVALVRVLSVGRAPAAAVSTATVLTGGFLATNRWVFGDVETDRPGLARRGGGYYATMLGGKVLNYGLYLWLLSLGVWYPLAWLVGAGVVFAGTFTLNRLVWYATGE